MPASADGERVLTLDELARQFRVSRKTVSRWRRWGLIGRRFLFDGRRRIGFLESSVERFVADNAERVRRGARFSRLTDEERRQMIERSQCLARAGGYFAEVSRQIARETGRSPETVRYTLKRFDQEHPDMAIFPYNHGPLRSETKRQIFQQHRRGESAEALARRFCQTRPGIHRILNEVRAARILELPLDCIDNEQFPCLRSQKRTRAILGPPPKSNLTAKKPPLPNGLPAYLASLYEVPLLTREQEAHLFRKMNYLKYLARKLRASLDLDRPKRRLMDRIENLYEESVATKNRIISANLRLVVSIAKRYVGPAADFFELVSDGNVSLIRAVEKFDFARGFRFSTYATWAIMKNFARSIPAVLRHQDRFRSSSPEMFSTTEDMRADQHEQESAQIQRESRVGRLLSRLDEREQQIITGRFGLARGQEPLTLKQVGAVMGVTKERIRQIQFRAIGKLRKAAVEDRFDFDMAIAGPAGNSPPQHNPQPWGTSTGGDS
ncbi:MAG: sigma-70 family RNA polymerase sigma factor [Thermoguttaceae bacterium]|jgi:RNA polymerase primary sigma factor/RNA polymerase sigma factor